jgi:glutathione S-transferase
MPSIDIPDGYGYVLLTAGILPSVSNVFLGAIVMKARKQFNVQYPNLYGVPGYHKNADEFNRVQRGHQHIFEAISDFRICSLIGGLQHPIAVAVAGLVWNVGSVLFMLGYKDTALDVKTARLRKGGPLQPLAGFFVLGCAVKYTFNLLK